MTIHTASIRTCSGVDTDHSKRHVLCIDGDYLVRFVATAMSELTPRKDRRRHIRDAPSGSCYRPAHACTLLSAAPLAPLIGGL